MNTATQTKLFQILALTVACTLLASSSFAAIEGGDAEKGKVLAKEKCKYCHVAGAEGGTMTPLSKTQKQWARFFKKDRHNKMAPGAWNKIAQDELKDVKQYMYDHAADSDQPETCGQ